MALIQETKMASFDSKAIGQIWNGLPAEFEFLPASGSSGGLLLSWSPSFFVSSGTHKGSSWLAIEGTLIQKQGVSIPLYWILIEALPLHFILQKTFKLLCIMLSLLIYL